MSIFVNTNVSALGTIRQVSSIQSSLTQSYERLSSGFRINSARDDAAGLQISDRMTSQVNGLTQAVRNANDGISVVQTADGAMQEITTALQRMRVLAAQAQNGINSPSDLQALQKEVGELKEEIDRIADTTQFAGRNLLDGNFSSQFLVGANAGQNITVSLTTSRGFGTENIGVGGLDVRTPDSPVTLEGAINPGMPLLPGTSIVFPGNAGTVSGLLVSIDGGVTFEEVPDFTMTGALNLTGTPNIVDDIAAFLTALQSAETVLGSSVPEPTGLRTPAATTVTFAVAPGGDRSKLSSLTGLSLSQLGPESTIGLSSNLSLIDGAISRIGSFRSELGALQNRFQSTIRNLSNIEENVLSARSRIRDTDYATETAELSTNQIIQQASLSVLTQANQRPQAALSLLQN